MSNDRHVVIVGGGIAGLAAALSLADRGFAVTVVERDPAPPVEPGLDPFLGWRRRGVPQFRLPHGFSARTRNLLAEHAPQVLDRLSADGIEVMNLFKELIPPELWEPGDDAFANLWARRAAFELALRCTAEARAEIRFECPAVADGLRLDLLPEAPRVTGVRLADGRTLDADVVLDCAGQRTPVPRWLGRAGVRPTADDQDCQTVYFSRYYRFSADCALPRSSVATLRGEVGDLAYIGFPGDHDTFAICFEGRPDDERVRQLRHAWAFEAVAREIPAVAVWVDPANGAPLTQDVQVMGGHHNLRRHYVVDGRPLVLGLLPVGDSLCTTNPAYGWGSAMALTYAFTAASVVAGNDGDLVALALDYEREVASEADAVFSESAAMDRARIYRQTGQEPPERDRAEMERQRQIAAGLAGGVLADLELGRAFCRRVNLVGPAREVLNDPDLLARAVRVARRG